MCDVDDHFNVMVKTNDTAIDPVTHSIPLTDASFTVHISGAHCSEIYDISLAFENSAGSSDFSVPFTVGLPTGG